MTQYSVFCLYISDKLSVFRLYAMRCLFIPIQTALSSFCKREQKYGFHYFTNHIIFFVYSQYCENNSVCCVSIFFSPKKYITYVSERKKNRSVSQIFFRAQSHWMTKKINYCLKSVSGHGDSVMWQERLYLKLFIKNTGRGRNPLSDDGCIVGRMMSLTRHVLRRTDLGFR